MPNRMIQNLLNCLVLIIGLAGQSALANVLVLDNFSDYQRVSDEGDAPGSTSGSVYALTGTGLSHVSRTFVAEATASDSGSDITIKSQNGLLKIANGPASAGQASILWNFDPVDFTKFGSGLLLEVVRIDLDVNAELIVNGVASSGIKTFTGVDDFLVNFSAFSNSAVFSHVSSLRLNFSGPPAWDGQLRLLMDGTPPTTVASVPLPTAYILMGSVLFGLVGISRKKPAH